jgi:hypothetical protein
LLLMAGSGFGSRSGSIQNNEGSLRP